MEGNKEKLVIGDVEAALRAVVLSNVMGLLRSGSIENELNKKLVGGALEFDGKGQSLCTDKDYGDFEMIVDWKITNGGDSGIYLRGTPQVQIWDIARTNVGAQVGSGGLYNNQKNERIPLVVADNPINDSNTTVLQPMPIKPGFISVAPLRDLVKNWILGGAENN